MAVTYYFAPPWFINIGIIFEALFAIVLIAISITACFFVLTPAPYAADISAAELDAPIFIARKNDITTATSERIGMTMPSIISQPPHVL